MAANLSSPIFHNEEAAKAHIEKSRWPNGPVCPHCESVNVHRMGGKTQAGYFQCRDCREKFTIRTKTVFERSHIPMHKWLFALHLMAASKKGVSAHQIHRMLGITYKSAWFMAHRIREAMRNDDPVSFGSDGGAVEVDETFIGRDKSKKPAGQKKGRGWAHKYKIIALVDRDTGKARSIVIDDLNTKVITQIMNENMAKEARLMTDEASYYTKPGATFASHDFVAHGAGEYGRGEIHTNTIEGFFSIFKRGMKGIYQHCGHQHLHRYTAEFEFRYNHRIAHEIDDTERAAIILKAAEGRRLTYRRTDARPSA